MAVTKNGGRMYIEPGAVNETIAGYLTGIAGWKGYGSEQAPAVNAMCAFGKVLADPFLRTMADAANAGKADHMTDEVYGMMVALATLILHGACMAIGFPEEADTAQKQLEHMAKMAGSFAGDFSMAMGDVVTSPQFAAALANGHLFEKASRQ